MVDKRADWFIAIIFFFQEIEILLGFILFLRKYPLFIQIHIEENFTLLAAIEVESALIEVLVDSNCKS